MERYLLNNKILLASVLFLFVGTGCNEDSEEVSNTTKIEALAIDNYSTTFNIDPEESNRRLLMMENSQLLSNHMIEELGEDMISGIYFDNGDEFKAIVRTTEKNKKPYRLINSFLYDNFPDLAVEIISNSTQNFRNIDNIIKTHATIFSETLPGFQSLAYSPELDSLILEISEEDKSKKESIVREYNLESLAGMKTIVELIDGNISPVSLSGGGSLLDLSNSPKCTGGWPAKNIAGEPGIITAYHCILNGSIMSFNYNLNDGSSYKLSTVIPPQSNHDLVFLKAPSGTSVDDPTFYKNFSQTLSYVFEGVPTKYLTVGGTQLCHFGRTTGNSCGIVSKIDGYIVKEASTVKDRWGNSLQSCNGKETWCGPMVVISGPNLRCNSGDSGGPVYFGRNRPQGIASGCNLFEIQKGEQAQLYFSPLDYAPDISVVVQTVDWSY